VGDSGGEYNGREMRRWSLTDAGAEYLEALTESEQGAVQYLSDKILELEIVSMFVERVKEDPPLYQDELVELIQEQTEVSGTTAERRAITLGKWLSEWRGPVVRRQNKRTNYIYQSGRLDTSY
jgi:hypothetical protein